MLAYDWITILNPRFRDKRKFLEIVDSIANVGLKQPIKVGRVNGSDGEPAYNLVYGQRRVEAFIALGQTAIPAIVTELSEEGRLPNTVRVSVPSGRGAGPSSASSTIEWRPLNRAGNAISDALSSNAWRCATRISAPT